MTNVIIALCELVIKADEVKVAEERLYQLIPVGDLGKDAIRAYFTK